MILLLLVAAAAAPPADPSDYRLVNPRAIELFERDSTLMDWALQRFDSNADGYLSIFEADKAAREFKAIADGDNDGQVTPTEYRSARDFVVARWAVRTR
jgi:hypothetical protein